MIKSKIFCLFINFGGGHLKIKKICRLNGRQREEIRGLESICKEFDNIKSEVYLKAEGDTKNAFPCFYLAYSEERLIGFLSVYFITEEEVEIMALVHPEERKKGCFTKMLHKVKKSLKEYDVKRFLFVHEPASKAAIQVLKKIGAELKSTEFLLSYQRTDETGFSNPDKLTIETITEQTKDIEEAIKIHQELFQLEEEETKKRILSGIEQSQQEKGRFYIVKKKETVIGICSVLFDTKRCYIYDFGICVAEQEKGNGKHMLELVIHELRNDPHATKYTEKFVLHVSGENQKAFQFYINFGFQIAEQYDYYSTSEI